MGEYLCLYLRSSFKYIWWNANLIRNRRLYPKSPTIIRLSTPHGVIDPISVKTVLWTSTLNAPTSLMEPSSTRNGIHTILKTQTSVDKLMSYLELRDICRMARTSRDIAISVNRYRRRTWDINKFLRRWFNSPTSFRKTLRICDAILHDTAVRGFFDRDTQQSRLDILLSLEGLYVMGVWLERSGYTMLPHRLSTLGSVYRLTSSLSTLCINLASYARIVHTVEARHIVSVVFSNRKFPTTTVVVSVARKDPIADILNSHSST